MGASDESLAYQRKLICWQPLIYTGRNKRVCFDDIYVLLPNHLPVLSVLLRTQDYVQLMAVILRDIAPPIREVSELGYAAVAVYSLLFESAHREWEYTLDKEKFPRDTGGTTTWSHKAIAETLKMGKAKVIQCTDILLDAGFLQVVGRIASSKGSKHRIYRVIHPNQIQAQRAILALFNEPQSRRNKRIESQRVSSVQDPT